MPATPTLTPSQIFVKLDQGEISLEEAKVLLAQTSPPVPRKLPNPTPTYNIPTATLTPSPKYIIPTATPSPTRSVQSKVIPTPGFPGLGSAQRIGELELDIHRLVNEERQEAGIKPLVLDAELSAIARSHSVAMADNNYFSHESLSGLSPSDRGEASGYFCFKDYGSYYTKGIGENIYREQGFADLGQGIASRVVDAWMNSPGHRKNILTTQYSKEGIGIAASTDGRVYVTQNFC